jgi:putative tryptophan/tyrosine transport system substrate-binding protein
VKRREFIAGLGGAAAWPLVARAQQPVVGFLRHSSSAGSADLLGALRHGLDDTGFVEGKNLTIDYRWSETVFERLPTLASELANHSCSVLIGAGNAAALALKAATTTIPIVFATGDDPVQAGIVTSLNRPSGNVTGVWFFSGAGLQSKQLEFLREAVPGVTAIGIVVNPNSPAADSQAKEAQKAAQALGEQIYIAYASTQQDFDPAFATLIQQQSGAILISGDALFTGDRARLIALAERYAVPTMFFAREFVTAGGLLSYGASISIAYRQVGAYVGKLLKGAIPGELPVSRPTAFELAVNLKTAKALGLKIPEAFLMRADEVIE